MNIVTRRLPLAALFAIIIVMGVEVTAWQFGRESLVVKRLETRLSKLLERPVLVRETSTQAFDSRHYDINNPFFNQPGQQSFMQFVAVAGAGGGTFATDYFGFRNHLGDKIYFSPH